MSFLKDLFHKKECAESVVLVDIAADSVAGAYARYVKDEAPVLLYTRRFPVETRAQEPLEQAMMRALGVLGDELIREGAPILLRATGSGSIETILVSVDTPWQETSVRTERFERATPFIFTKSMVTTALKKASVVPPGKILANESIICAILNGYETHNPYGKKIHRAALIILASFIDKSIFDAIVSALRGLYHTKHILSIAGNLLRYQAIRIAFPHEREFLIFDATGPLIFIALIRKGVFVALAEAPQAAGEQSWMDTVKNKCTELAKQYPLPRTIFLLARESETPSLQQTLTTVNFNSLWLSNNPPKIVPVLASHIVGLIRQATAAPLDLQLLLMALYYQHHSFDER